MGSMWKQVSLAVLAPVVSASVVAQELENVLVTGTYAPTPVADLSSSLAVLEEDFIRSLNKRSVVDVLRTVPGLLIEEQGGAGGLTAVSIRGGESNFTVVLVDGVQLNDPTNTRGGSFDFSNLDVANIERIEVVRGPQSAVYGSDALAGVINIITRRPSDKHQQNIAAELGENDYEHFTLGASGAFGALGYSLQATRRDSGEQVEGSTRENDEFNLGLNWTPAERHALSFNYRYLDGERTSFPEQSGGPEFAVSRELDHNAYEDNTLAAAWRWQLMANWQSDLGFNRFEHSEDYFSPGIYPFFEVPAQVSTTEFTRDQVRWVNSLEFGDGIHVAAGADYRREDGDSQGELDFGFFQLPTDFQLDRRTTGLFIDGHTRPVAPLLLQASIRYDDPDDFDSETTVKLGAKYDLSNSWSLSGNWGEAFKLPSFFALGHALVGNPELRPETADSWDVGLNWAAFDGLQLGAHYFSNEYSDLIDFDPELFINVNRKEVDTTGVEFEADWAATATLQLVGHATYTDIDVKDDAAPLGGRPDWAAGATALWQVSPNWRSVLDYQWIGEQYASSMHSGESVTETLDDYHLLDLSVAWQMLRWASVELAVDNLLDEDYHNAVGFPGPGRTVRVALRLDNR